MKHIIPWVEMSKWLPVCTRSSQSRPAEVISKHSIKIDFICFIYKFYLFFSLSSFWSTVHRVSFTNQYKVERDTDWIEECEEENKPKTYIEFEWNSDYR